MKPGFGLYGGSGPARGGLTGGEKFRLAAMAIAALGVLVALLYSIGSLRTRLRSREEARMPEPAQLAPVPAIPKIDRDLLRRETRDATVEGRLQLEPAPLAHLLGVAGNLLTEHFLETRAGEPDSTLLEREPARFRGDLFRSRGRLLAIDPIVTDPNRPPYFRGAIRREAGDVVFFAVAEESGNVRDDFVRLDGVFWKVFEAPAGNGSARGPLLVGRRLASSVPSAPPVRELDARILALVRDETAAEKEQIEPEPYWHLLSFVREAGGSREEFEEAPELDRNLLPRLVANPAEHRGKPFRLFGKLADLLAERCQENGIRLEQISVGWLMNFYTGVARFDAPFPREAFEGVGRDDLVWVEAYFLKNFAYQAVGGETTQAPFFVARRVERYVEPHSSLPRYILIGALGSAVLTAAVFFLIVARDKKDAEAHRAETTRRRRGRLHPGSSRAEARSPAGPQA